MSEFEEWFEAMRRRAWDEKRAGFKGDPMYEHYLEGLRPYFLEAWNHVPKKDEN